MEDLIKQLIEGQNIILTKVATIESNVTTIQSKVTTIETKIDNLESQTGENTQILKALEHRADVSSSEFHNLSNEVAHIKGDVSHIKNKINDLNTAATQNINDITNIKATM